MKTPAFFKQFDYKIDKLMSRSPKFKLFGLFFISIIFFLIGTVSYALFVNDQNIFSAAWIAWTYLADPGSHVGELSRNGRVLGILITLAGLFFFALLISLISDGINERVDKLRSGRSSIIENNHFLILGWSDKIYSLISQLVLANKSTGGCTIVVLANKNKSTMESSIKDNVDKLYGSDVVCRTGGIYNSYDLDKVSAFTAKSIIILAENDNSDPDSIRAVLALINKAKHMPGHITVELINRNHIDIINYIGKNKVESVVAKDTSGRILAQASRQPGLGLIYESLLDFNGPSFHFIDSSNFKGKSFGEIYHYFSNAMVCGVYESNFKRLVFCQDSNYILKTNDKILILANDLSSLKPSLVKVTLIKPEKINTLPVERNKNIYIFGWGENLKDYIFEITNQNNRIRSINIISLISIHQREKLLPEIFKEKLYLGTIVNHIIADPMGEMVYEEIKIDNDSSIVITHDIYKKETQYDGDSNTLLTLLLLRNWLEQNNLKNINITTEITDKKTKNLVASNISEFVVSTEMISKSLASASYYPLANKVWKDLFTSNGNLIYIKPLNIYIQENINVSFNEIAAIVRSYGAVILGYWENNNENFILNPENKNQKKIWSKNDLLIVIENSS